MLPVMLLLPCRTSRALDFLARVRANDCGAAAAATARRFVVGQETLGRVLPIAAHALSAFPQTFEISDEAVTLRDDPAWSSGGGSASEVDAALAGSRSAAVSRVLNALREEGAVPMLRGWRDEAFAVRPSFYAPPRLVVERAAAPLFGLPSYGCFTNGFVVDRETLKPTHVWLGRRAENKPTWPGLLDCVAAGGIAAGASPTKAMVEECAEEAGIPREVARGLTSAGGVSYTGLNEDRWGIKEDVLFVFDLRLDPSFEPVCTDGEMSEFRLVPIEEVADMLASSEAIFKPNVGVVMIDFLVRHGFVDPDEEGYVELLGALRSGALCSGKKS
ncbi:hypothetical protein AB1Y20_006067 [Prymnesium parvum]|uniref:Nudix hydrolase domain-containing protein n=1 Tax=Prymnesium parvum TaxID=97485 RepID=A0AB34J0N6_PRYPA